MFQTFTISDALKSFLVSKSCHEKDFTQRRSSLCFFFIQRRLSTSSELSAKELVLTAPAGGTGDKAATRSECWPPLLIRGLGESLVQTTSPLRTD